MRRHRVLSIGLVMALVITGLLPAAGLTAPATPPTQVNVAGSFIMGALVALMAARWNVGQDTRAFLTTGILGGFTTFSAFSLDFALLVERRDYLLASSYVLASVGLSLIAIMAGLALVRMLHP